jgi:hypothetical protein
MVNYFNNNNLKNATAGRQLNNYNLTEQPQILDAYRSLISTPYFLSTPQQGSGSPPPLPRPFAPGQKLSGQAQLSIWVKTYVPRPSVFVQVGEKIVYAGRQPGAHSVDVDVSQLSPGRQPMTIYIYDNRKRFVAKERTVVVVE